MQSGDAHVLSDLEDAQRRINWCLDRDEKGNVRDKSPWNSPFDRMEQSTRPQGLDDEDGHGYSYVNQNQRVAAERMDDPQHSGSVGIVGTCQDTFREEADHFHKLPAEVEKAIAAAGGKAPVEFILLAEVHRACIIVGDVLFIWNYVVDELRRYGGPASTDWFGGQHIIKVNLVMPRAGAFDGVAEDADSVLVVTTAVSIFLLAVVFVGGSRRDPHSGMRVVRTSYVIPTDDVKINIITGTTNGRIFLGGSGGYVYELVYEPRGTCSILGMSGWKAPVVPNRGKRFRKTLTVSDGPGGALRAMAISKIPDFVRAIVTDDPKHFLVLDVQVDHTRNRMYTLTATVRADWVKIGALPVPCECVVAAWSLGATGETTSLLCELDSAAIKAKVLKYIDRCGPRRKWLPEKANIEAKQAQSRRDIMLAQFSFVQLVPLQVMESDRSSGAAGAARGGGGAYDPYAGRAYGGDPAPGHPHLMGVTRRGIRVYFRFTTRVGSPTAEVQVVYLRMPPAKLRDEEAVPPMSDACTKPLHYPRARGEKNALFRPAVPAGAAAGDFEPDLHRAFYFRGVFVGALGPRQGNGVSDSLFCCTTDQPIWTRRPKDNDRYAAQLCEANVYGRWVRTGFRETVHTLCIKEQKLRNGVDPPVVICDIGEMPVRPLQESRLEGHLFEKSKVRGAGGGAIAHRAARTTRARRCWSGRRRRRRRARARVAEAAAAGSHGGERVQGRNGPLADLARARIAAHQSRATVRRPHAARRAHVSPRAPCRRARDRAGKRVGGRPRTTRRALSSVRLGL